jgi:hypothetical protein
MSTVFSGEPDPTKPHIDLLSDSKGLYGFQVYLDEKHQLPPMAYRPDVVSFGQSNDITLLHGLPTVSKKMPSAIGVSHEYNLFMRLREALAPRKGAVPPAEWRRKYFGAKSLSMMKMNWAISKCLEECADQEALRIARRFNYGVRGSIYAACCASERARQICEVFPVIAVLAYKSNDRPIAEKIQGEDDDDIWKVKLAGSKLVRLPTELQTELCKAIAAGRPLKDVARIAVVPMALRNIKPQAAHLYHFNANILRTLSENADYIYRYAPVRSMENYRWLSGLMYCFERDAMLGDGIPGPKSNAFISLARWMMKNMPVTMKIADLRHAIFDIYDWFCNDRDNFKPELSWRRAQELSAQWHERRNIQRQEEFRARLRLVEIERNRQMVERARADAQPVRVTQKFPQPWVPAATLRGYTIVPITSREELFDEACEMHHCVDNYGSAVENERCYIYSVRKGEKRIATVEVTRQLEQAGAFHTKYRFLARQVRGPCNAAVAPEVLQILDVWLGNMKEEQIVTP